MLSFLPFFVLSEAHRVCEGPTSLAIHEDAGREEPRLPDEGRKGVHAQGCAQDQH